MKLRKDRRNVFFGLIFFICIFIISIVVIIISLSSKPKVELEQPHKDKPVEEIDYQSRLIEKGYDSIVVEYLLKTLDDVSLNTILEKEYDMQLNNFGLINSFDIKNYSSYTNLINKYPHLSHDEVVSCIETNTNCMNQYNPKGEGFYINVINVDNPMRYDTLVNKNNRLDANFEPSDLVLLPTSMTKNQKEIYVRKDAANAFFTLSKDLKDNGFSGIIVSSGYRSYSYQKDLYNDYVKINGKDKADTYSARPGYSEHQLGLAIDYIPVYNQQLGATGDSEEYQWIKENAHNYGFIIRYTKANEGITGYINEPWHIRYVGLELASILYHENITLEEYYQK